ncbi:uncharacterized protein [Symphalangus syndactylus]|uniref:uncharacterized protein n=1 Tax=Symphalangus syndactylus TaxID=9590 RepID=UPI0030045042
MEACTQNHGGDYHTPTSKSGAKNIALGGGRWAKEKKDLWLEMSRDEGSATPLASPLISFGKRKPDDPAATGRAAPTQPQQDAGGASLALLSSPALASRTRVCSPSAISQELRRLEFSFASLETSRFFVKQAKTAVPDPATSTLFSPGLSTCPSSQPPGDRRKGLLGCVGSGHCPPPTPARFPKVQRPPTLLGGKNTSTQTPLHPVI